MSSGIKNIATIECGVPGRRATVSVGVPWASGAPDDPPVPYLCYGFREDVDLAAAASGVAQVVVEGRTAPPPTLENWPTRPEIIERAILEARERKEFGDPESVLWWVTGWGVMAETLLRDPDFQRRWEAVQQGS